MSRVLRLNAVGLIICKIPAMPIRCEEAHLLAKREVCCCITLEAKLQRNPIRVCGAAANKSTAPLAASALVRQLAGREMVVRAAGMAETCVRTRGLPLPLSRRTCRPFREIRRWQTAVQYARRPFRHRDDDPNERRVSTNSTQHSTRRRTLVSLFR
jgi:hypothetical protein